MNPPASLSAVSIRFQGLKNRPVARANDEMVLSSPALRTKRLVPRTTNPDHGMSKLLGSQIFATKAVLTLDDADATFQARHPHPVLCNKALSTSYEVRTGS